MTKPNNPQIDAAIVKAALERWKALPEEERNGERPFVMGLNAGWDEASRSIGFQAHMRLKRLDMITSDDRCSNEEVGRAYREAIAAVPQDKEPTVTDDDRAMAELLCKERCAQLGDPPCSRVCNDGHCDECLGMAKVAIHHCEQATAEAQAEIERLKRGALDAVLDAKLPYERQAAGRDDSGVALTLQRQRSFTFKAVRKVFDTLATEKKQ